MTKAELRKKYLSKQNALSSAERNKLSVDIARSFFQNVDLRSVRVVHCFVSIEKFGEVDTRPIFETFWKDFPQIMTVVPRVDFETNEMRSLTLRPDTPLARNAWDIDEPSHEEFVEDVEIDMVLVPGAFFDRDGHRVGYGKGFYDRFLKRCRTDCVKVGLTYFHPLDEIDDLHGGDVAVNRVIVPA